MFAVHDPASFFSGLVIGIIFVGMGWIIYIAVNSSIEYRHEKWIGNKLYSTHRSQRIFGVVAERVADGHWINLIKSVWRTGHGDYFFLHIDELNPPSIVPVTAEKAKAFIREHAKDNSFKIIRDWFGEEPPIHH